MINVFLSSVMFGFMDQDGITDQIKNTHLYMEDRNESCSHIRLPNTFFINNRHAKTFFKR